MLGYEIGRQPLALLGENSHQCYTENKPFPHIVIDEFFDRNNLETVLTELDRLDRSKRYAKFLDRKTDHNKFAFYPDVAGPNTARLALWLNSGPFLTYLEKLTGISESHRRPFLLRGRDSLD